MIHYIIPARKGSKGIPFKNRKLLDYTLNILSKEQLNNLTITTDDEVIIEICKKKNINYLQRPKTLSDDNVCIKHVLFDCADKLKMNHEDIVVCLYLTYPQRTKEHLNQITEFFINNKIKSLLCRKEPDTHPYLCFYDNGCGQGKQIIKHDLYRRQDYPKCFELSFFVCMYKAGELKNLSHNMFNEDTYFYPLPYHIDIDTQEDLEEYLCQRS